MPVIDTRYGKATLKVSEDEIALEVDDYMTHHAPL